MKKYKKLLILGFLLVVLVGCTNNYLDPNTHEVLPDKVIALGNPWIWGVEGEGWFEALFVWPLAQLLNFFAQYTGAFISITIVSLLIRLVTIRSTIKTQENQIKMQQVKPEIDRLELKYKGRDDQQSKLMKNQEIMKIYEKHGIKPTAGMGGLLLQLPIIFAMYQAVSRASLIIDGSILGQSFKDTPMYGFETLNWIIIILYVLMIASQAASTLLPGYFAKRKAKRYPNQPKGAEGPNMQVMMLFSTAMIGFLAINWPLGMTVYWLISSLSQLLQTVYINFIHKFD